MKPPGWLFNLCRLRMVCLFDSRTVGGIIARGAWVAFVRLWAVTRFAPVFVGKPATFVGVEKTVGTVPMTCRYAWHGTQQPYHYGT